MMGLVSGLSGRELSRVRGRLVEFAAEMFESMARKDQRWRIEHDYREFKDALGLDHFEGRTHRGFNHHVTLVSVAHAFLSLERRRHRPRLRAAAGPLPGRPGAPNPPGLLARNLPGLPQRATARTPTPRTTNLTRRANCMGSFMQGLAFGVVPP
jgi:hypothetical protein